MNLLLVSSPEFALLDGQLVPGPTARVRTATTGEAASAMLSRYSFDCILICAPVEDCTPESMLEACMHGAPATPVVVRNRVGSFAEANRCLRAGAALYLGPDTIGTATEVNELDDILSALPVRPAVEADEEPWMKILVGRSTAMRNVAQVVRLVASRRCNVLVSGETGTGKELAARAIHAASARSGHKMIAVNCSALPENLLEAELFGHTRGAFTGAQTMRVGRFEEGHKSTLFLDEIADLPFGVQTKLLRVLQEREVQRLGSSDCIKIDFRLIAACNVNLPGKVLAGAFREDLYYRLNTVPLEMPALRERREDIPLLVRHFLHKICAHESIPVKRVGEETVQRLCGQNWPGNVRQLENSVEMAIALSGDREVLHAGDFRMASPVQFRPNNVMSIAQPAPVAAPALAAMDAPTVPDAGLDYDQVVGDFERGILREALRKTNGNKKAAADILRLKRTTLNAKLKSLEAMAC